MSEGKIYNSVARALNAKLSKINCPYNKGKCKMEVEIEPPKELVVTVPLQIGSKKGG